MSSSTDIHQAGLVVSQADGLLQDSSSALDDSLRIKDLVASGQVVIVSHYLSHCPHAAAPSQALVKIHSLHASSADARQVMSDNNLYDAELFGDMSYSIEGEDRYYTEDII